LFGQIDGSAATFADLLEELVMANPFADRLLWLRPGNSRRIGTGHGGFFVGREKIIHYDRP
jgi:hypothetical protein